MKKRKLKRNVLITLIGLLVTVVVIITITVIKREKKDASNNDYVEISEEFEIEVPEGQDSGGF